MLNFSVLVYWKILKYFIPVENPQIARRINETVMTPIILPRILLLPQRKNMNPIINPNNPIIEPNAMRNSIAWPISNV
jgi:hypothetical protein